MIVKHKLIVLSVVAAEVLVEIESAVGAPGVVAEPRLDAPMVEHVLARQHLDVLPLREMLKAHRTLLAALLSHTLALDFVVIARPQSVPGDVV